ncbi:hypothetical protein HPP92_001818 [Vanilla planifolia]|uniref:Uncharacterized protein n=1 Tax=Vanilla planifolia TaxID=51239 RepID=A0A835VM65_VANPL|nr:hypothetical protein HPP92_001818 [Vanilla planifolia]
MGSKVEFYGVPYVMNLFDCLLSPSFSSFYDYRYGLHFVSPSNMLVMIMNGAGALLEAIYALIFILYVSRKGKVMNARPSGPRIAGVCGCRPHLLQRSSPWLPAKARVLLGHHHFFICMSALPLSFMLTARFLPSEIATGIDRCRYSL